MQEADRDMQRPLTVPFRAVRVSVVALWGSFHEFLGSFPRNRWKRPETGLFPCIPRRFRCDPGGKRVAASTGSHKLHRRRTFRPSNVALAGVPGTECAAICTKLLAHGGFIVLSYPAASEDCSQRTSQDTRRRPVEGMLAKSATSGRIPCDGILLRSRQ